MSEKPKGLPGFLRRSLRLNDDDEDADQQNKIAEMNLSTSSVESRTRLNGNGDAPNTPIAKPPRPQQKTPTGTPMATPAPTPIMNKQLRSQVPDIPTLSLEKAAANKGSWAPGRAPSNSSLKRNISYKDRQFDATIQADIVNMADLKRHGWNGIASEHRPMAWKLLLGYLPTNSARRPQTLLRKRSEYKDAIAQHYDIDDDTRTMQEQETLRQVLVDVPRTAPDVKLFRDDRIRKALSRLLYIWACRHPASSYVQGINDLATPLVVVFLQEYGNVKSNNDGDGSTCSSSILDGSIMKQVSDTDMEEVSRLFLFSMLRFYTGRGVLFVICSCLA